MFLGLIKKITISSNKPLYFIRIELVLVCVGVAVKPTVYQRKVDGDM